jgi:ribosomal protein L12E/L44/L45/RPP1/RPP2
VTRQDRRRVVTVALCKLAMATCGQELDPERIVVYLEQLDDDPVDEVLAAIARLTRTARFFPSVGEIVAEMQSTLGDAADQAWQTATFLARADGETIHSAYSRDNRLEAAVQSLGGGIAVIRNRTQRDEPYMRARFVEAYKAAGRALDVTLPCKTPKSLR